MLPVINASIDGTQSNTELRIRIASNTECYFRFAIQFAQSFNRLELNHYMLHLAIIWITLKKGRYTLRWGVNEIVSSSLSAKLMLLFQNLNTLSSQHCDCGRELPDVLPNKCFEQWACEAATPRRMTGTYRWWLMAKHRRYIYIISESTDKILCVHLFSHLFRV